MTAEAASLTPSQLPPVVSQLVAEVRRLQAQVESLQAQVSSLAGGDEERFAHYLSEEFHDALSRHVHVAKQKALERQPVTDGRP